MSLKKFALISLLSTSMLSFSELSYAEIKISVVETRKIMENSIAHNDILSQIQKKNEEFRDGIQKAEAILKKKYEDFETKKNALSDKAADEKREEMSKEVAELQRKSYSQHASLDDAYRGATQLVVDKTSEIVKKHAEKNGYALVLEKAVSVYSDSTLDITEAILEELNKTLPKVEVKFQNAEQSQVEQKHNDTAKKVK